MSSDLVIVGGGVMGLMTAYHASGKGASVTIVERGRIGDPMTASFGRTRSYRTTTSTPSTRGWRARRSGSGRRSRRRRPPGR